METEPGSVGSLTQCSIKRNRNAQTYNLYLNLTEEFVSQLTPAVFFLFRHPWAVKSLRSSTQSGSVKP
ncbi:hypothetical protein HanPSC8_Chr01g0000621 [Helianthus annuus]|nr:hypothetical protein HanPSC8_Chr01g0000621 [Helianthus annuus]